MKFFSFSKWAAFFGALLLVAGFARLGVYVYEFRQGSNFELTLIHTNDFHSRIRPINKYDSQCKKEGLGKCFGGSARLAKKIQEVRAAAKRPVLLVDGGDQFQGSLFYSYYKGKVAAELMNRLGYEAMVLGNHEFDDGPETVAAFMRAVEFPVVGSNIRSDREDFKILKKSTVIEKGGERIGIVGYTTEETSYLSHVGKVQLLEPFESLQNEVDSLRERGINKIVLLSHAGFNRDRKVAKKVSGIDVIVSGHSNTFLKTGDPKADGKYPTVAKSPGGKITLIVSAYAYGKYLGQLDVVFDPFGEVVGFAGGPITLDEKVEKDLVIESRVTELERPVLAVTKKVVGRAAVHLQGNRKVCRQGECNLGNWLADALRQKTGTEIAVQNAGGIRASLEKGQVTSGDLMSMFPYSSTVSTFKLRGADVIAMLEHGVSAYSPDPQGRFLQVSGLKYQWDRTAAVGKRIQKVSVLFGDSYKPIDPKRVYSVSANDYIRQGGDEFKILAKKAIDAYDYGPLLLDVFIEALKSQKVCSPRVEGRITEI